MRRHSAISKCICRLFQLPKQDQSRKSRVGIRTRYSPVTISSRISDSPTPWWNPIVSRGRGRVKAKSFFSPSAYINVRANLLLPNCITTGSGMNHLSPAFFLVKVPREITPPSFGHRGGSTFSGSRPGTYRGAWHGDPNFLPPGPAPKELLHNRHPFQRVAGRGAAGFHRGEDPYGPGIGTEPANPVWRLLSAHGGRRGFPAASAPRHPGIPRNAGNFSAGRRSVPQSRKRLSTRMSGHCPQGNVLVLC